MGNGMPNGFLWRLEEGYRFKEIALRDCTVIMVYGQRSVRHVEVHTYPTREDARDAGLLETQVAEKAGLELCRVYRCSGSDRLRFLVHDARMAYIDDARDVGRAVDRVTGHIIGNSTILFPRDWR